MARQYCASVYIIDFKNETVLLMFNKKLNKWLQPGGHIEGAELPFETCIREAKEETGMEVSLLNKYTFTNFCYQPVFVEHYMNNVGDMIDFQFIGVPKTNSLSINSENNLVKWQKIKDIDFQDDIDNEIKVKVKLLFERFANS